MDGIDDYQLFEQESSDHLTLKGSGPPPRLNFGTLPRGIAGRDAPLTPPNGSLAS